MADILEFPSKRKQGLTFLERELRQLLRHKGADGELVDFASDLLISLYHQLTEAEHYQCRIQLPEGLSAADREALWEQINSGLAGVQRESHTLLVHLVARLVLTELKLFQRERADI
ncbi:MAG: hypothetical protein ACK5HY_16175 [Parahaliea sp.]